MPNVFVCATERLAKRIVALLRALLKLLADVQHREGKCQST
jgi:hypothetical protein